MARAVLQETCPGNHSLAAVRFGSHADARRALLRAARFVATCPASTEWVCENCDGIADYWQWSTSMRNVGRQSTAWSERARSLDKSRARVVVARQARTVVEVTVGHANCPDSAYGGYPKAPTKTVAVEVTGTALRAAT